jgi:hypothetical protein
LRGKLGLEYAPFASPHAAGALVYARPQVHGVHTPSLYFSGPAPGAPFEMNCEDHWLYSFNYLHRGAPKYWVVVAPHERKHLEKYLWGYMSAQWGPGWDRPRCSQFVRHLGVWVSLGALQSWNIDYLIVKQMPGELMVTAPEAYHQGWSVGAIAAETIHFDDGASERRHATYKPCSANCYPEAKRQRPVQLQWLAGDNAVAAAPDAGAASQNGSVQLVNRVLPDVHFQPWTSNDMPRKIVDLLSSARTVAK